VQTAAELERVPITFDLPALDGCGCGEIKVASYLRGLEVRMGSAT
jgi:hypothetical protein